jgi:hypothetical protein
VPRGGHDSSPRSPWLSSPGLELWGKSLTPRSKQNQCVLGCVAQQWKCCPSECKGDAREWALVQTQMKQWHSLSSSLQGLLSKRSKEQLTIIQVRKGKYYCER